MMDKAIVIEDKLPPTRNQHDYKHEDDSTEPKFVYVIINFKRKPLTYKKRARLQAIIVLSVINWFQDSDLYPSTPV